MIHAPTNSSPATRTARFPRLLVDVFSCMTYLSFTEDSTGGRVARPFGGDNVNWSGQSSNLTKRPCRVVVMRHTRAVLRQARRPCLGPFRRLTRALLRYVAARKSRRSI